MRRLTKMHKELNGKTVHSIIYCTGPIRCFGIQFTDGTRLDLQTALSRKHTQVIPAEENPYVIKKIVIKERTKP